MQAGRRVSLPESWGSDRLLVLHLSRKETVPLVLCLPCCPAQTSLSRKTKLVWVPARRPAPASPSPCTRGAGSNQGDFIRGGDPWVVKLADEVCSLGAKTF